MLVTLAAIAGVLVTLFGIYIAQSIGLLQISVAHKEHNLNLLKSAPIIDTTVRLMARQVNPPSYDPFHYIVTSINNYGELAAQKLDGYWRIYSPDKAINERNIPIFRDALGSAPYEFDPCQLIGPRIDSDIKRGEQTTINVDIEFDYFGLSNDQPQHYGARYQYDRDSKQMVRIPKN